MEKKLNVIVLAMKMQEVEGGRKFPVYFAYRQELGEDGTYHDQLTPMTDEKGSPIFKAKPIKVRLSEDFEKKLQDSELTFPLMMDLDSESRIKNKDGKSVSSFFVTVDTDRETKQPRLDKYGKKHLVMIIRDAQNIREKPMTSYSLDDLDDFE